MRRSCTMNLENIYMILKLIEVSEKQRRDFGQDYQGLVDRCMEMGLVELRGKGFISLRLTDCGKRYIDDFQQVLELAGIENFLDLLDKHDLR